MSIQEARGNLENLAGKVEALTQAEVALTQDERFTTLPQRYSQISDLAVQLDKLLEGVNSDTFEYVMATFNFYDPQANDGGPRCVELAEEAEAKLKGEEFAGYVSRRIRLMGEPFGSLYNTENRDNLLKMIGRIYNYRTTVRRVGTFSTEMAGILSERAESVPEALAENGRQLKTLLEDAANRTNP
jgi:hypothetical protein